MKMDVPKFDGTDPQGWIFRVEEFFDFHGTPDHMRLRFVSLNMEGRAVVWFEWMKVNNLLTTWPEFIVSLKNRFCSSPYNDPQGPLSKLTQPTVAEFQSVFEDLMNKEGSELKCSKLETKAKEFDDLADSNVAVESVENDALLDYVETKVVEKKIYVDSFNLHLEDKMVLKGRRVDTTKKREKKY